MDKVNAFLSHCEPPSKPAEPSEDAPKAPLVECLFCANIEVAEPFILAVDTA